MRIVVSGTSGFLGGRLVQRMLSDGHEVVRLVRRPPRTGDERRWDPYRGELPAGVLDGVDAVVNLSGAGVGDKRWSEAYKKTIRDSRVMPTTSLATAIARADRPPSVLLNAAGIHYYGDTGEHAVDEDSPPGTGWFVETSQEWEAATDPAADAGVRVVLLRTAPVLAASGPLLKPMLPLFRLGLGGRLSTGTQYMSWISLADWLGAVMFLLEHEIAGPVNLSAPHPETNREFTRDLAAAVRRPAVLPVPRFAIRIALGEFGHHALESLRVMPGVLDREGYQFQHPHLAEALRWALKH
ncbi:MAG: TIGR01777 family oxidoreductase [Micromonosporaceae bacterium]